jgi:hypothetical protein
MSHKLAIWETMRCRPITLVSATHGPDGQLHQEVIAGPRLALNSGLPEEGLYILYHNRGLQIASTACDQRRCGITQVCRVSKSSESFLEILVSLNSPKGFYIRVRVMCLGAFLGGLLHEDGFVGPRSKKTHILTANVFCI